MFKANLKEINLLTLIVFHWFLFLEPGKEIELMVE